MENPKIYDKVQFPFKPIILLELKLEEMMHGMLLNAFMVNLMKEKFSQIKT